jgi:hypothetical protein
LNGERLEQFHEPLTPRYAQSGQSGGLHMRPRAGTLPVTLEPQLVVEVLSLARQHDDMLKEARQDLFRAETKLNVERRWKWPIRLGCVALGASAGSPFPERSIDGGHRADFFRSMGATITSAQATRLWYRSGRLRRSDLCAVWLIRRAMRGPDARTDGAQADGTVRREGWRRSLCVRG